MARDNDTTSSEAFGGIPERPAFARRAGFVLLALAGLLAGCLRVDAPIAQRGSAIAPGIEPPAEVDPGNRAAREQPATLVLVAHAEPAPPPTRRTPTPDAVSLMDTSDLAVALEWVPPMLIHAKADITLAVPCEVCLDAAGDCCPWVVRSQAWCCSRYRTVALRKQTGADVGRLHLATVRKCQAFFRGLSAGVYEVFYLSAALETDSEPRLPAAADRRLIIEPPGSISLATHEEASAEEPRSLDPGMLTKIPDTVADESLEEPSMAPWDGSQAVNLPSLARLLSLESNMPPRSRPPLGRSLRAHGRNTRGAWQLLRKRALHAALKEFRKPIMQALGESKRDPALPEDEVGPWGGLTWNQILDGSESVTEALRRRSLDPAELAACLVNRLDGDANLADALYGLGKSFDAIAREPEPLIPRGEQMAIVCYLATRLVDANHDDALNDLAVLCERLGWREEAELTLCHLVARSSAPEYGYNLGVLFEKRNRPDLAESAWAASLAADPRFVPCLVRVVDRQARPDGTALYDGEYRRLAGMVRWIGQESEANDEAKHAALALLERLEPLAREIRLNDVGFHGRWLLRGVGATMEMATIAGEGN